MAEKIRGEWNDEFKRIFEHFILVICFWLEERNKKRLHGHFLFILVWLTWTELKILKATSPNISFNCSIWIIITQYKGMHMSIYQRWMLIETEWLDLSLITLLWWYWRDHFSPTNTAGFPQLFYGRFILIYGLKTSKFSYVYPIYIIENIKFTLYMKKCDLEFMDPHDFLYTMMIRVRI